MNKPSRDLVTQFRINVMTLIYGLLAIISLFQGVRSITFNAPPVLPIFCFFIVTFCATAIIAIQFKRQTMLLSAKGISVLILTAISAETFYGRHPFSPVLFWVIFVTFAGFLVGRRKSGIQITWQAIGATLLVALTPFFTGFHDYPLMATRESYIARMAIAIPMIALIPWALTFLFERVLRKNRKDMESFRSGMEKQRNKALLAHFANSIVADLRVPLQDLQHWLDNFRSQSDPQTIVAAKVCIEEMGRVTDRYRQLSLPSQMLSEQGIVLEDFLNAIQTFSPGSSWMIRGALPTCMRLRGDHVVTLQLILCLGLMNAQTMARTAPICLEVEQKIDALRFTFLYSSSSFFHEIQLLLQDMQGSIEHVDNDLHISIPLARIS